MLVAWSPGRAERDGFMTSTWSGVEGGTVLLWGRDPRCDLPVAGVGVEKRTELLTRPTLWWTDDITRTMKQGGQARTHTNNSKKARGA